MATYHHFLGDYFFSCIAQLSHENLHSEISRSYVVYKIQQNGNAPNNHLLLQCSLLPRCGFTSVHVITFSETGAHVAVFSAKGPSDGATIPCMYVCIKACTLDPPGGIEGLRDRREGAPQYL